MKISVYDTYVRRSDGRLMHFDILVPDTEKNLEKIHGFGRAFLQGKGESGAILGVKECRFCHVEQASPEVVRSVEKIGYYIIEMENC